MTKEEFCKEYNYSLSTLKTSFGRIQNSMKNKGYIVKRTGSWPNPDYQVTFDETLIPEKKVTLNTRLIGQRFGHLTVIEDTGKRLHRSIIWKCKCDCGNVVSKTVLIIKPLKILKDKDLENLLLCIQLQ